MRGVKKSANARPGTESIRVLAVEDAEQGHGNNLKIEGQAPVAEIVQIVLHSFRDRSVTPPPVYLRPAGNADLKRVAEVVAIKFLQKSLHKMSSLWSRTNDAHIPLQHVKELG